MQNPPVIGILLANLGTPDAPTPHALRRYLAEFLWDRRIVDLPRPVWWLILHGVILRIRPRRSARAYKKVWTAEGSPLLAISRRQASALQSVLDEQFPGRVRVALGMRYGNPSIASALHELRDAGADKIVVLPLFPQNSCSTTASVFDAVAEELKAWRKVPALRLIADYHADGGYLDALSHSIREAWGSDVADKLLFSFHGTPERFRREGDPYYQQCMNTASWVANRLGLPKERWDVVFQSRFSREEWLRPYADEVLGELPSQGVERVDMVCPGFAADCLETLEEIAEENRDHFLAAGGAHYRYIPALNDRSDHVKALATIIARQMDDWLGV